MVATKGDHVVLINCCTGEYKITNPRRMCGGYSRLLVIVCVSVCLRAIYLVHKCPVRNYSSLRCLNFTKNALFKRYGIICLPQGPSTLSADRRLTNDSG